MRSFTIIAAVTFAAIISMFSIGAGGCSTVDVAVQTPSAEQALPVVAKFLVSEYSKFDNMTLSGPENVVVGEYLSEVKAWPVYADYEAKYSELGRREVQGSKDEGKNPTCFISNKDGQLQWFKPSATSEISMESLRSALPSQRPQPAQPNRPTRTYSNRNPRAMTTGYN